MIGDSQVTRLEREASEEQAKEFIFIGKSGLRVEGLKGLICEKVFSNPSIEGKFSKVVLWVGGNNADDTYWKSKGTFSPQSVEDSLAEVVMLVTERLGLPVLLLSASRRKGNKGKNIKELNTLINSVAADLVYSNVHICNIYRKLSQEKVKDQNRKRMPTVDWALENDGVHINACAAGVILNYVRQISSSLNWGGHRPGGHVWVDRAVESKPILVQGPECVYSNFFPSKVVIYEISFNCGEQAYQYIKAVDSGDWQAAERIMILTNPFDIKAVGARISVREWTSTSDYKRTLTLLIMGARVEQQVDFREALKSSGRRNFVHTVRDRFWGTSLQLPGRNMYGRCLRHARKLCSGLSLC